jgi:hypothetical protein
MPNLPVDLSWQSIHLLKELERWGIYGVTKEEIAARFIDRCLTDLAERKHLKLVKPEDQNGASNGRTTDRHSMEALA